MSSSSRAVPMIKCTKASCSYCIISQRAVQSRRITQLARHGLTWFDPSRSSYFRVSFTFLCLSGQEFVSTGAVSVNKTISFSYFFNSFFQLLILTLRPRRHLKQYRKICACLYVRKQGVAHCQYTDFLMPQ